MVSVNIIEQKFEISGFDNVESYFLDYFGIIHQDNVKQEKIRLKFIAEQGIYIETKPLHHSQRLVSKNDEYFIFELQLRPTFDFFQELLSFGSDVEILSPDSLREQIAQCVQSMSKIYL